MVNKNEGEVVETLSAYKHAYLFDVAKQGIYYEKQSLKDCDDYRKVTAFKITGEPYYALRRNHLINSSDSLYELENLLKHNRAKGQLGETLFVLGHRSDPFSVHKQKYDNTLKLLEIFTKYKPGKLLIQTYSHLAVLAISKLLPIKDLVTMNFVIETSDDAIADKFSPGTSEILDRFKAASAMKTFGFDIEIQVAPLLPYSGGKEAAKGFAEKICKSCDRVYLSSFAACTLPNRKKKSPLAFKLASKGLGEWLRKGVAEELRQAIAEIDKTKLEQPEVFERENKQLVLFVA